MSTMNEKRTKMASTRVHNDFYGDAVLVLEVLANDEGDVSGYLLYVDGGLMPDGDTDEQFGEYEIEKAFKRLGEVALEIATLS